MFTKINLEIKYYNIIHKSQYFRTGYLHFLLTTITNFTSFPSSLLNTDKERPDKIRKLTFSAKGELTTKNLEGAN